MGDVKYLLWTKITVEELKAFLGFCILMGINSLPALKDYWKRDPAFHYSPIADRISRDRFLEISRYLHFVDNDTFPQRDSPAYDRLGKVRPLIDHFTEKFISVYSPHKEVAVDEAMIKFTGRSSVKQYMPMKGMGTRRQQQWLLQQFPGVHWQGGQHSRDRAGGKSCQRLDERPEGEVPPRFL